MYRLVVIFATVIIAVTSATNFEKCAGDAEQVPPNAVRIKGCDKSPCTAFVGRNLEIEVDFTSPSPRSSLLTSAWYSYEHDGIYYQDNLPLSDDEANFCGNLLNGDHCPVAPGKNATYKVSIPIPKTLRGKRGDIFVDVEYKFELYDSYNCFSVDCKIF